MRIDLDALVITGFIMPYVGEVAPAGWLLCTGSPIAAAVYPALCVLLPEADRTMPGYHLLPDIQSKVIVGNATGSSLSPRTLYFSGGSETESLSPGQLPVHTHLLFCDGDSASTTRTSTPAGNFFGASPLNRTNGLPITTPYATTPTENATLHSTALENNTPENNGVTARHNNMMPYVVLNFIIKT